MIYLKKFLNNLPSFLFTRRQYVYVKVSSIVLVLSFLVTPGLVAHAEISNGPVVEPISPISLDPVVIENVLEDIPTDELLEDDEDVVVLEDDPVITEDGEDSDEVINDVDESVELTDSDPVDDVVVQPVLENVAEVEVVESDLDIPDTDEVDYPLEGDEDQYIPENPVDRTLMPNISLSVSCDDLELFGGRYIQFSFNNQTGTHLELLNSNLQIGDNLVETFLSFSSVDIVQTDEYIVFGLQQNSGNTYGPDSYLGEGEHDAMTIITTNDADATWSFEISFDFNDPALGEVVEIVLPYSITTSDFCADYPGGQFNNPNDDDNVQAEPDDPQMNFFAVVQAPEGYIIDEGEILPDPQPIIVPEDNTEVVEEVIEEIEPVIEELLPEVEVPVSAVIEINPQEELLIQQQTNQTFDYYFQAFN